MNITDTRFASLARYLPHITLVLVVSLVAYVRIHLLQVPLERDEGEYAYMGQLLLKGLPPYVHAYSMKLPGVSVIYALIMALFGQSPLGIHVGLLIVNGISILFVYLLALRLFDRNAAIASSACYAVMSLSQSVLGAFAHASDFVVLFSLAGFVLLLIHVERGRLGMVFSSGLCFGLAFTMKQPAALLTVFAFLYLAWCNYKKPNGAIKTVITDSALFLLGSVIPYVLIILWVLRAGSFDKFWFWTVSYAREYTSELRFEQGLQTFTYSFSNIMNTQLMLWLLAGAGAVSLFVRQGSCTSRLFIAGYFIFSFIAITPGLFFRRHYFDLILPAIALLIGAAIATSRDILATLKIDTQWLRHLVAAILIMAVIAYNVIKEKEHYFELNLHKTSHATYGLNPFPEAIEISHYLKDHTTENDRIAVLGSEPEIFFYADRLSATGHIYMYGLMEQQPYAEQMQREMIREIEASNPKYIVVVNMQSSWLRIPSSSRTLSNWANTYLENKYSLDGVIDIIDLSTTYYMWGNKAATYYPASKQFLTVFKRKE